MIAGTHTKVMIVGAGPTGLALAIELGSRRIPCVVVERNDRVGYAPRAKTTNVRTREHLRRWGIADKLAAASPLGLNYPSHVSFVTRLGGINWRDSTMHWIATPNAIHTIPSMGSGYRNTCSKKCYARMQSLYPM